MRISSNEFSSTIAKKVKGTMFM